MISDRWRAAEKVAVSVCGVVCDVLIVKPSLGTAEIRHTPPLPKRTVALPPCEEMVCTPDPPSSQPVCFAAGCSCGGGGVVRAAGVGVRGGVFSGVADGVLDGDGRGLGEGEGPAAGEEDAGSARKPSGADCATGAVGLVEPTTKWTVSITAVTLAAVHDSQMSR
ncbi:hypothetical protein [Streptomyces sp. WMMC940]|uniref:hypothetical protein n=1 Tax=Streptomyces sp. WMMC940 TaxID=3015153 RepID=UPI0022B7016D|nr:hypothetical protein [Streptomyces sp. WMMC940]MCZ7462353.1 hypothetical protein [Streptomyces sp. WMMC940]